jgi:putative molybdopterin biosynthesis protein
MFTPLFLLLGGTMTTESLLTAEEVANVLRVSRSKVYSMMRLKEIPTVTIGKNVRVCKCDLEDFIQRNRTCNEVINEYERITD